MSQILRNSNLNKHPWTPTSLPSLCPVRRNKRFQSQPSRTATSILPKAERPQIESCPPRGA
eukprot:4577278-Pyramimonas_sp.AAC.1